jgi:DNA-directed RNA polymerase subunit RPC12/RpoP
VGYNQPSVESIFDSLEDSLSPVQIESVVSWVERNCELPTGAITGKVQMKYIPYGREILECYADKTIRHLVLAFATQSAKTTLLILGMLFRIARDPEDALWIMANGDQARDFNKERFMGFVRHCKSVMDLVPRTAKGAVDKHLWGFLAQHYSSMVLNFGGAGSPANLASRPRGLIQQDEVDKFYDQLGFDAGTIALVEERQKTFHFPMSVKASSPTLADRMIWVEYLKTDQRKFHVPCPRCSHEILLKFSIKSERHGDCGVRWWHEHADEAKTNGNWDMKKVRALAHYKCQECGGMIHSFERPDMLEAGIWRPSNPNAETGRRGYQLSSLYSILGQETSLASIAVKFLLAKGLRSELQNFINGWLAEPFDESMAYDFKEVKLELFTPQDIADDAVPLMSIDVQEIGYWYLIRKFQRPSPELSRGQSWLLDAGFAHTIEELDEKQKEYNVAGENVTMDMAHRPNQVARMIIERNWRGVWGSNTRKFQWTIDGKRVWRPYSVPQFRDPMLGTSWGNRTFQRAVFCLFSKHDALDMVSSLRYAEPAMWHCTVNVHPDYAAHLNSRVKRKEKNKRTGKVEWVWHELHQRNHLADCESHVTIRALQLGLLSPPNETEQQNVQS